MVRRGGSWVCAVREVCRAPRGGAAHLLSHLPRRMGRGLRGLAVSAPHTLRLRVLSSALRAPSRSDPQRHLHRPYHSTCAAIFSASVHTVFLQLACLPFFILKWSHPRLRLRSKRRLKHELRSELSGSSMNQMSAGSSMSTMNRILPLPWPRRWACRLSPLTTGRHDRTLR